ncbi:SRPBCC family protein [Nonomuraea sp. NPDC050643]|uniref:SRPBCC family protein n=1 Tax=Nonomuraea sp. NPDC050643 TaxID=3155660 RepID=UPI0033FA8841
MRCETGVAIDAPAERVWQVLTDVERWPEFTPTMTSVRLMDDGPLGTGATVRIKQPGIPRLDWVVTEFRPGVSFTWETITGGVTISAAHVIEPRAGGGVTVVLGVGRTGRLAPLLTLLGGRRTRRHVRVEAESLKRRCEAR